jgi:16S rRNA processing protein RimM
VLNLPGQDVLVIAGGSSEILIPFVRALVPEVDIAKKKLVVIPPIIDGRVQ